MGGNNKAQTVGYRYSLGVHLALCHGPIDAIREILVDRRPAWSVTTGGGFSGGGAAVETRIGSVAGMSATAALAGDSGATLSFPGSLAGVRIGRDYRLRLANGTSQTVTLLGASIGPEPGVAYIVEIRWVDPDTGAAILPPGIIIDAGLANTCSVAPDAIPESGAPDRTAEIDVAVRSRRLVEGAWLSDREARWFRLTAPFAAGWDRGWGVLWGT